MRAPFLLLIGLAGCTAAHRTRTVGSGHAAAALSLGGPVSTALGPPVPMPVVFLGGRYGLRDDLDLSFAYNLTAPAIPGIPVHLEAGVTWAALQPGLRGQPADQGWSALADAQVIWLSDLEGGSMVFPALGLTGAYRYRVVAPYLGLTAAVHSYRPFGRRGWLWLTPRVGVELMAGPHLGLTLEASWMDAAHNLYGSGMDWVYLAEDDEAGRERGVLAPMIGFTWDFDTRPGLRDAGAAGGAL